MINRHLTALLDTYDPRLSTLLQQAMTLEVRDFHKDLFPSLEAIDKLIPGAGFQHAIWVGKEPKFPFPGWEFDGIARPMRYIPDYLASSMSFYNVARSIAELSGGHAEESVKAVCGASRLSGPWNRMPLGTLARQALVRQMLTSVLADQLILYARVSYNPAKHEYRGGSPEPVISFPDALAGYFVSRILGAQVLLKGRILDDYVRAIEAAREKGLVYAMPEGYHDAESPVWPLDRPLRPDE